MLLPQILTALPAQKQHHPPPGAAYHISGEQLRLCFGFTCTGSRHPCMKTLLNVVVKFGMPCLNFICLLNDNILLFIATHHVVYQELCMLCVKQYLSCVSAAQTFLYPSYLYYEGPLSPCVSPVDCILHSLRVLSVSKLLVWCHANATQVCV